MRGRQTSRFIRLLLMLSSRRTGETVADLAKELNASVRTVYRDLEALQEAGVPLSSERDGDTTVWRITNLEKWRNGIPLGLDERMALHVAAAALRSMGAAHWSEPLSSALDKINAATPGHLVTRLAEMVESFSASDRATRQYEARREIVSMVSGALLDRRPLDIQYATPGRGRALPRRVLPYHLRMHDRGVYLVGHDSRTGKVRTFLVDRIRLVTVGEGTFDPPDSFNAERYFARALGVHRGGALVRLEALVKPSVAHLVEERRWHPSQRTVRTEDGTLLTLEVADTPELRSWVRSFGADMIVLEPESLGRDLVAEAERMSRDYAIRRGRRRRTPPRQEAARRSKRPPEEGEE